MEKKNLMIKKILTIFVFTAMIFIFVGCSNERERGIVSTILYSNCVATYNTVELRGDIDDNIPSSILCTNKITNKEEEIDYETYLKSKDPLVIYEIIMEKIEQNKLTREQRYMFEVFMRIMEDQVFNFVNFGEIVESLIPGWDYGYIVIECDEDTEVEIRIWFIENGQDIKLNVYNGALGDEDNSIFNVDNLTSGDKFTVTFTSGFNTIEFNSYASQDSNYIVSVNIKG